MTARHRGRPDRSDLWFGLLVYAIGMLALLALGLGAYLVFG